MAVEFTAEGAGINFGNRVNGLTTYSISSWFYADSDGFASGGGVMVNGGDTSKPVGHVFGTFDLLMSDGAGPEDPNDIVFTQSFSGTNGIWYTITAPSLTAWHNFMITYDNTNVANDPIFYLDGASVAITENSTPSGTAITTSDVLGIGYLTAYSSNTWDGKLQDTRIYNRILSVDEVAELYNSRMQNKILNGLVFWSRLDGAKGLSLYDGATLGTANTFIDEIGGAIGTPSGSPIGRGNTIQRVK